MLRSEPANCALPPAMPARRPTSVTPISVSALRSSVERSGVPASCNEGTLRALAMSSTCVVALVEHAGGVHPPLQVLAAVDAGRPNVLADRQGHRTARAVDLVGDLGAARRCADDQDAAVGELVGIAVLLGRERGDRGRHQIGKGGNTGDVAGSGSEHDRPALPVALVRAHQVPRLGAAHRRDRRVGLHRGRDRLGVAADELDDFRHRPVAVGIVALVAEARQPALPVRGQQPQRIPALGAPGVRDLAALQDHMVDRALGEAAAHGQAGVPGADDDGGDGTN